MAPAKLDRIDFFVPTMMWGETFRAILVAGGHARFGRSTSIRPFPLGEDQTRDRNTSDEVREVLRNAERSVRRKKLPVIVMPLPLAARYAAPDGDDQPTLTVLAPALKTRDDIFLFLVRGKCAPLEGADGSRVVRVAMKGEDLTTTYLGAMYRKRVIEQVADPLFDSPLAHSNRPGGESWRQSWYVFDDETGVVRQAGETKDQAVLRSMSGQIIAGPSLRRYWYSPDWQAAVNLNAWICRRLGVPYFVRAVFCTLPEAYSSDTGQFATFWDEYQRCGMQWANQVRARCSRSHRACIGSAVAAPIQAPAVTGAEEYIEIEAMGTERNGRVDAREELVRDLVSCLRFLGEARDCKGSTFHGCRNFMPMDFRAVDCVAKWRCAARLASVGADMEPKSELVLDEQHGRWHIRTPGVRPEYQLRTHVFFGLSSALMRPGGNISQLWGEANFGQVIDGFVWEGSVNPPTTIANTRSSEELASYLTKSFLAWTNRRSSGVLGELKAQDPQHGSVCARLMHQLVREVCE